MEINTQNQIKETMSLYRGLILDSAEDALENDPVVWGRLRNRLLKILGDRGLEKRLLEIVVVSK